MILPDNWKIAAMAGLGVAAISVFSWLLIGRANLKAELAQARADDALCQNVNADWAAKAAQNHQALVALQQAAQRRSEQAAQAQKDAQQQANRHALQAKAILAQTSTGSDCEASQALLRQYIFSRRKP